MKQPPLGVVQAAEIHRGVQRLTASGQTLQRGLGDGAIGAVLRQRDAGLGHGQQQASQVAAVHRRDIGRLQHFQCAGVVPVEQMAVVLGQFFDAVERGFEPPHQLAGADPAELAGAAHGQQVQADVGRRGAVRHGGLGHEL